MSLRDVEDALVALRNLQQQQEAQQRALDHAREAYRLAEVRWRAGAQDFTTVLDAQRSLIGAEAALDPILARASMRQSRYSRRWEGTGWRRLLAQGVTRDA